MDTIELPQDMKCDPIYDDSYVLTVGHVMKDSEREKLAEFASGAFGGKRVIVLEPGMRLERIPAVAVMERIEVKLDLLISLMLDDEEQPDRTALEDEAMDNQEPQSL